METAKYIIGTCTYMCPIKEAKQREKQRLLHSFEVVKGTEKYALPKADLKRVVKSFSRSAAGKDLTDPENLRPPLVLLETVEYLLHSIIDRDADWLTKYNFIMDRLRSVRQDMVIQNLSREHQILILQPIIRFHAYAAYRFCEETINDFDQHINNTHLQECTKRLLCMYNYFDYVHNYLQNTAKKDCKVVNVLQEYRPYFETLYLIFNLGDVNALNRILNLPKQWRTGFVLTALEITLSYFKGNFFRVCKLLKTMPLTIQMVAYVRLPELRRLCFERMSVAYNPNFQFSLSDLSKLLLYDSETELISDCKYYNISVKDAGVHFSKTSFRQCNACPARRSNDIDKKLMDLDVSTLLLFGNV